MLIIPCLLNTFHKFQFYTFNKIDGENTNSMILNYIIDQSVPCFK